MLCHLFYVDLKLEGSYFILSKQLYQLHRILDFAKPWLLLGFCFARRGTSETAAVLDSASSQTSES